MAPGLTATSAPGPLAPTPPGLVRTARLFLRLRLRLQANSFRGGAKTVLPALLSLLSALVLAGAGVLVALALRSSDPDRAAAVVIVLATFLGFGALVGPVFFSGVDDSLGPARLAPFPLSPTHRLVGLGAAASVAPPAVATAVAVGAVTVSRTRSGLGAPLAVLAAVGLWLLLVVTSRLLATAMARLAASRRGRDLSLALAALVAASGWTWGPLIGAVTSVDRDRLDRMAEIVRWTPPGALGRTVVVAGAGAPADVLPDAVLGLAGLVLAAAGWWWLVGRDASDGGTGAAAPAGAGAAGAGMFSGVLGRLPRTPSGAVTARELKYLGRDPRQRVGLATMTVLAVVVPVLNVARSEQEPALTLVAAASGLLAAFSALNLLGNEGRGIWIHLLSGVTGRDYLIGKNRALLWYLPALVLVTAGVMAALTGGWSYLPAAAAAGLGTLLVGLGVGTVNSVRAPAAVPEGSNPFASTGGEGCVAGLLSMVSLVVVALIVSPVAGLLAWQHDNPGWCTVVGLGSVAYGAVLWRAGIRLAVTAMAGREPELLDAVAPVG